MPVLRSLESLIAGAVEGTFSRVFRSEVRPVEIARKLAREMDEQKHETLARIYVPNEFRVYLSPRDRERFASYEEALTDELASYLLEYARRERFALLSRPVIEFDTDERLGLGEFGIETGAVQARAHERVGAPEPDPRVDVPAAGGPAAGGTMVFSAARHLAQPGREQATVRSERALLLYAGRRLVVGADGGTLGRSRECDVVVSEANVSRRHAELRPTADGWIITDLGSTNGTRVNGRQIRGSERLRAGDEIELGDSVMTFELE
jgi:hypothetical protein